MLKRYLITLLGFWVLFPSIAQSQPDRFFEHFFERWGPKVQPGDLRILQLDISPEPLRRGQPVSFQAIILNASRHPVRVSLFVRDREEVVTRLHDILLQPGQNRIVFPPVDYRFSRFEYCFTVDVDIEQTRKPVDLAKEFCIRRLYQGWTSTAPSVGPIFVEDLTMYPDPVSPSQEVRFKVRLRNDGWPLRANLRIHDRDQIIAQLSDAHLPRGHAEYQFPYARYSFQRMDHCFSVIVDVERTPYQVDAMREFCAKPLWWTLRP